MSDLPLFLGRFHPLLVHLPIGLLVAAGGLQAWAWWRRRGGGESRADAAVGTLLGLAAAGAVAAAVTGTLLGTNGGYAGEVFERHRILGFVLAASSVLTAGAWLAATRRPGRAVRLVYAGLLIHSFVLLIGAGHAGGTLTHGESWLTEMAPRWAQAILGNPRAEPEEGGPAGQRVVFDSLVEPVLQKRCVSCHGPDDPQGGLRLDSTDGIAAGGEGGAVVRAGRPGTSPLWRRVSLPPTHPEAMPPRGRAPVTAAEGALLRWWIAEGASFEARLSELDVTAEVQPAVEGVLGPLPLPGPSLPQVDVEIADPATLAAATEAGFSIGPIAEGVPFVQVSASVPDPDTRALEPLAAQVAWLDLGGAALDDAGVESVGKLRHLVRLDLSRTAVTDAGLAHLKDLASLEALNLFGTRVTDAGLGHLAGLAKLRRLYLWRTTTTHEGVESLRVALPGLEVDLPRERAQARSPKSP